MKFRPVIFRLLCLLFLLLCNSAFGQIVISGIVRNDKGDALPFASVRLMNDNGVKTDTAGIFQLQTVAKGKQILSVSSVGYKTSKQEIVLADSSLQLDIILSSDAHALNEVTISAGSFEASDRAKGASLTPIDAVTVAGSNADISFALRALPGAQQIGEQEGLFVRGGASEETKQFIDGTLVKNPNYPGVPGVPQYARINPFLFKGILFSTGGYSALYGDAMSSALILESVDLPEKSSASFSLFSANVSAGLQHLAQNNRSSYGVTIRYSNQTFYNAVVPQKPDYFSGPQYIEGDANFRIKTGKAGMLKFYANWNTSDVGMYNPDIDSNTLRSGYQVKGRNIYSNLSYRDYLSVRWKIDAGLAYSYNQQNTINTLVAANGEVIQIPFEPYEVKNSNSLIGSHFAQARVVLTHFFSHNQAIRFGAEHFYTNDKGRINDTALSLTDNKTAAFAEADIYLANNLAAKIGTRAEYAAVLNKTIIAPRASIAYRINNGGQFNFAYGIFYQEPEHTYLYFANNLNFSSAAHYVLNYTQKANNRFFRIEAYYKQYNNLVKTEPQLNSKGDGYAQGIELFWRDKKSIKNLDYWITYTYLDTKRDFQNYPSSLQPSFAAPHTATIAIKSFSRK